MRLLRTTSRCVMLRYCTCTLLRSCRVVATSSRVEFVNGVTIIRAINHRYRWAVAHAYQWTYVHCTGSATLHFRERWLSRQHLERTATCTLYRELSRSVRAHVLGMSQPSLDCSRAVSHNAKFVVTLRHLQQVNMMNMPDAGLLGVPRVDEP